jgi:glycosyltransferase involved in cell wall biosynthesis
MRVTFILPGLGLKPGGGVRVIYRQANYLVERGHQVGIVFPCVLGARPASLRTRWESSREWLGGRLGVALRAARGASRIWWLDLDRRVKLHFVENLDEQHIPDADAVIATFWRTAEAVNNYPETKGEKFYFIQHYEVWGGPKDRVDATWRMPMHRMMVSKWLQGLGVQMGLSAICYVPPGVDHQLFRALSPLVSRPPSVVGFYSSQPWKGTADALAVFERLHERYPALRLSMFGVEPARRLLPHWLNYYENPRHEQLAREVYNTHSIYVCASHAEGWGLPPAEAMASGCAVVSTDCGGVRDYAVDGETALLSPPGDRAAMFDNLCRLLDDDGLRIALAERGTNCVHAFTWERSGPLFEGYLCEVLAQSREPGAAVMRNQFSGRLVEACGPE